MTRIEHTVK